MSNVETGKGICSTAATSSSCVSPSRRIPENQSKEKANVAELKNGKIVFRQKSHSFEKHSETLQELVKFREMLSERSKSNLPLTEIEDEYRPLIVKLAYESDKTLNTLAKHIHSQLLPSDDEDEDMDPAALSKIFPVATIEKAIQVVMNRNNYGLELDSTVKIPNQLCIWRWEAKENYQHCLPKAALEKVAARLAERAQAKVNLLAAFNALSEAERTALIPNRGTSKSGKEASTSTTSPPVPAPGPSTNSAPSTSSSPSKQAETNDSESPKAKAGRPKKPENTERLAKAKKQKEAQKSLMANFFNSKPKAQTSNHLNGKATSSKTDISEFEKTFKSFVHKKDTELAPVNAFLNRKKRVASGTSKDIIVVDSDDESMPRSTRPVNQLSIRERLRDAMSALPEHPHYLPPRSSSQQNTPSYKTYYSPSVRELMKRLSEAEMTDDTSAVRSITQTLADRQILPAKVLIFHEDNRPGYFGTWTRSSRVVGSRTPFAKDVVDIDYGYDSGEDWDEGENAGDADDVVDEDDDDQDSEDQESDMDDWLVDDDEVEESAPPPPDLTLPDVPLPTKRKAEEDEKASKKRKVVVPLVPYAKGPCWESVIGECTDNVLSPYQIRFFNDASYSLDPFTFVSTMNETVKRKQKTEPVFAVPSLPHRAADASNPSAPPNTPAVKKSAPVAPKTAFPEAHLPVLLDKVNTLQSGNLTVLVEVVFQELRAHKVKKNAIEAKIKEVGMKCRDRKYWVVRENASSHSSAPMDTS
ncbi:hypothetical protein V5O48_002065 [Marasmius crinis-equi]|uniref:Chromatin assembly factor 1 subunit A dimerization domain-containing protein n=1 Tax=Marasmius crinis-equi TaxID=585013 RepID=A0ABR3FWT5_9AGAR